MRRRLLVAIATALLLSAALAALFHHQDLVVRRLLRYAAWRKFSPDAGTQNYADVNGVRLYYEDHGSGMPILVLHGGSGFVEMMGGQIPALAKGHRVIAVDSRGEGGPKLSQLIEALNQLKVPAGDRIAIIKMIHRTGKLHAELIIEG